MGWGVSDGQTWGVNQKREDWNFIYYPAKLCTRIVKNLEKAPDPELVHSRVALEYHNYKKYPNGATWEGVCFLEATHVFYNLSLIG